VQHYGQKKVASAATEATNAQKN